MHKSALASAAAIVAGIGGLLAYRLSQPTAASPRAPAARTPETAIANPRPIAPPGAPPVIPVDYRPVAPQTAAEINDAVPIETAGPPALPFRIAAAAPARDRATQCLAQAVYYEARNEPLEGQRAVAQVVLNRVRSPAFPSSICGVVYQGSERSTGCQFTFTCDGSLKRDPVGSGWQRALLIAGSALRGTVSAPVGHATHYHANYVVPYWASSMAKVQVIGAHDFYRWPGKWRASRYFSQAYANSEPVVEHGLLVAPIATDASVLTTDLGGTDLAAEPDTVGETEKKVSALAIDEKSHTLIASKHSPTLHVTHDRPPVLQADLNGGKLEPTPSIRGQER